MYKSIGYLNYHHSYWLTLEVDQGIADFYRALIPKYMYPQQQKYPAHITIIRPERELPKNLGFWGKYHKQSVEFYYDPEIIVGQKFFWLNAFSTRLEEVRGELGLPIVDGYREAPEGFNKFFHLTVANRKYDQIVLR